MSLPHSDTSDHGEDSWLHSERRKNGDESLLLYFLSSPQGSERVACLRRQNTVLESDAGLVEQRYSNVTVKAVGKVRPSAAG